MKKWIPLAVIVGTLYLVKLARQEQWIGDPEDPTGSVIDQIPDLMDIIHMASDNMTDEQKQANLDAFLWALRVSEGTATASEEGYRALFGWRPGNGKTFADMSQHPRQFFTYTNLADSTIRTSAAGAYQITAAGRLRACDRERYRPAADLDGRLT